MDSRETFKRAVYAALDLDAVAQAAKGMRDTMPSDTPAALADVAAKQMALIMGTAGTAYDMIAPTVAGQGEAIGAAVLGLDEAANAVSKVAMDHPELFSVVESLVATQTRMAETVNMAWSATHDALVEFMANSLGLGRKVLRGQAEFSRESQSELASIAGRMKQEGEAHPMFVFLHGGGDGLTIAKLMRMTDAGTFPTDGYPSPTAADCERYVAWAKARYAEMRARITHARQTCGYPTEAAIDLIYNQGGQEL